MTFLVCILLVTAASLWPASGASLVFDSARVTGEPGAPLELGCGVQGNFRLCWWETEDGRLFQVEDVHAGLHQGLRAPDNLTLNQCGVVLDPLTEGHTGTWTCRVFIPGAELRGEKTVGDRQTKECSSPFVALDTGCYYFHEGSRMNWDDARAFCQGISDTADLAVLDDCHDFQLVWNYILVSHGPDWHWIGGTDRHQEGSWHWVDGSPVPMGTPFWRPEEPQGDGGCLDMSTPYGYFNDVTCTNVAPFVCEDLFSAP